MDEEAPEAGVRKPPGVRDYPDQLRAPIVRGDGVTDSERYLAKLANKSFLNLWSYPAPYRDQKASGSPGKELCDLLVVCSPHIIIFSEKTIAWQTDRDMSIAWPRWYRRAIDASVSQIKGAERWIAEYPNRIFLDPACKNALPIDLPPPGERIIHRVVVAQGAAEACRKHFGDVTGSLRIRPSITNAQHFDSATFSSIEPLTVGDVDTNGPLVHVLDEGSLGVILAELDTITDFTDYLQKREALVRSGRLGSAASEQDLLAYYAVRINDDDDHDFTPPNGPEWAEGEKLEVPSGGYAKFVTDPQYQARRLADRDSYVWDHLITTFTDNMLNGTSLVLDGSEYNVKDSERCVRFMALERRFRRRHLGKAVLGALEEGQKGHRFFRSMLGPAGSENDDTGFFFLTLTREDYMDDYEKYRDFRVLNARTYAQAMLMRYPHLKRIVGIACEPPGQPHGGSEDLLMMEQAEWNPEQREEVRDLTEKLGILQAPLKEWRNDQPEFPEVDWVRLEFDGRSITLMDAPEPGYPPTRQKQSGNRKQRRAAERAARKKNRRK